MTEQALRKMIAAGESARQEFKLWPFTLFCKRIKLFVK